MPSEGLHLTSDSVGDIFLKHKEIGDWSVEAKKNINDSGVLLSPIISPTVKNNNSFTSENNTQSMFKVRSPYYIYVSNIPFSSNKVELFYLFGGNKNILDIFFYGEIIKGIWKPMGDCLLWLKDFDSLIRVLKMSLHEVYLCDRKLNISYVDLKKIKRKFFSYEEIDQICEQNFQLMSTFIKKRVNLQKKNFSKRTYEQKLEQEKTEKSPKKNNIYKSKTIVSSKPVTLLLRTGDSIPIKSIDYDKKNILRTQNYNHSSYKKNDQKLHNFQSNNKMFHSFNNNKNQMNVPFIKQQNQRNNKFQNNFRNSIHTTENFQQRQSKSRVITSTNKMTESIIGEKTVKRIIVAPAKNIDVFCQAKPTSQNEQRMKEKFEELEKEFVIKNTKSSIKVISNSNANNNTTLIK